jgi:predicted transcriptional regulator
LKYLEVLLMQGFIEQASMGGRMVYRITPKGHTFLKELKKIEQFSEAFGVPI